MVRVTSLLLVKKPQADPRVNQMIKLLFEKNPNAATVEIDQEREVIEKVWAFNKSNEAYQMINRLKQQYQSTHEAMQVLKQCNTRLFELANAKDATEVNGYKPEIRFPIELKPPTETLPLNHAWIKD
jgi:hypothetical protein